ncbi:bifunctional biotin--[acetyl-CoA-carboxylase] ligase/type III pantothenate kinase [Hydrogenophilus islandicus]
MPDSLALQWLKLESCTSTNDVAATHGASLAPGAYLAVTAERQSAGRGQQGRRWTMPDGAGIAFSVATRLPFGQPLEGLSLAVGAALAERLELLELPVRLKWPNDLLIADQKLGGILVEAQWRGTEPPLVVVGVGINHRATPPLDASDPWTLPPTAIAHHLALVPPAETLTQTLVGAVVEVFEDYRRGAGFTPWRAAWWERAAWRDRWLRLSRNADAPGETLVRLTGVNEDGALEVTTPAGSPMTLRTATARLRPVPLLLDLGNSRGKWYWRDDAQGAFAYDPASLDAWWQKLTPHLPLIREAVGVSVTEPSLRDAITARFAVHAIPCRWIATTAHACGVTNGYRNPQQLGTDRWVAAIGAVILGQLPAVIVGCGTATTLDWIDETATYRGGVILPGVSLMFDALARATAQLPLLDPQTVMPRLAATSFPPTDTEMAITGGVLFAHKGAIAAFVAEAAARSKRPPHVILHGGAAPLIAPHLDFPHEVRDNLLFLGLAALSCSPAATPPIHHKETP